MNKALDGGDNNGRTFVGTSAHSFLQLLIKNNPFAPELPVTARADPRPF